MGPFSEHTPTRTAMVRARRGMRMQDRRGTTGYRLTIWIEQTREEEATYRAAHQVSPDESLRTHLADHLTSLLEGEGALTGWWHILRIR